MHLNHLFDKLPSDIFRPLTSSYRLIYWRILESLQETLFEMDDAPDDLGYLKAEVLEIIEKSIASNVTLLPTENIEESNDAPERKPHHFYNDLYKSGWLHEQKRGFRVYVSMPQAVNALLTALMDIADARPLMAQGELLGFRDRISSIVEDPYKNANNMRALAKSARLFSRHLNSIKGSIKLLYDRITPDAAYSETVDLYFDNFIGEIYSRDYMAIKTSDHPLKIKEHILNRVSLLRFNKEKYNQLLNGYTDFDPDNGEQSLEKDLSLLERVFDRVEKQLDAIDTMGSRYNKRVDAVIAYAKRIPKSNAKLIQKIILTLNKASKTNPSVTVAIPICATDLIGQERFRKPTKPRESAKPKPVSLKKPPTPEILILQAKQAREIEVMKMILFTDQSALNFLDEALGPNVSLELSSIPIRGIADLFQVIHLQRLANASVLRGNDFNKQYPKLMSRYQLSPMKNVFDNEYIEMKDVAINRLR